MSELAAEPSDLAVTLRAAQARLNGLSKRIRGDQRLKHELDADPRRARQECISAGIEFDDPHAGVRLTLDTPDTINMVLPTDPNRELHADDRFLDTSGAAEAGSASSVGSLGSAATVSTCPSCLGSASSVASLGTAGTAK